MTSTFRTPDDWFQNAFPNGEGFADWLEGTDYFGDQPPVRQVSDMLHGYPQAFWGNLNDEVQQQIQSRYVDALLRGETPSKRHEPEPTAPTNDPDVEYVTGSGFESAIESLEGDPHPAAPDGDLPGDDPTFEPLEGEDERTPADDDASTPDRSELEKSVPGSRASERNTEGIDHSKLAAAQRVISRDGARVANLERGKAEDDETRRSRSSSVKPPDLGTLPSAQPASDEPVPEGHQTTITLPDGSTIRQTTGDEGVVRRDLFDRDGNHVRRLEVDDETVEEAKAAERSLGARNVPPPADAQRPMVGGGGIHMLGMVIPTSIAAAIVVIAGVAILAVIGPALFGGGGDDGSEVPASSSGGDSSGSAAGGADTSSGGGSSSGAAAAATTTTDANACQAAHDQQLIVDLASPGDVQPSIPVSYTQEEAQRSLFPTPYLEWSALPDETTEIAILVQRLTVDRGAEYAADPRLWWNSIPMGGVVWKVTGLDPSLQALPASSTANPLPEGAVEHPHENGRLTVGDDVYEQKLWIVTGEPHLFTVFALCDPPLAGTADDYNIPWLIRNAVGVGWFISALEQ